MNLQNIICPICNKQNTWRPENRFRPFCSERCKLIDLGEWANESRTISGDSADADFLSSKDQEKGGGDDH